MTIKSDRYRKAVPPAFAESKDKYLQDELTKIERVFDLAYDDMTTVAADGAVLKASIEEERTIRTTEDEALAQKITTLTATVDSDRANTAASLSVEQTARATRDDALAQQITTLTATVDTDRANTSASITAEQTARATKDDAIAQSVTDLTATVNTNNNTITARVSTEETARASADSALSTRITDLTATVTNNDTSIKARVSTEETARADADGALSTRIDTLTSTVNTNTASITTEQTARANADSALSTRIDTLTTTVNGNTSSITTEQTTRANADSALGTRIDNLTTTVNNNSAAITSEQTARANGDSANATSINNLTTTVNGHTTSISQNTSSINGLQAKWGVTINNNGRISGLTLNSGADSKSSFDVQADYFNIFNPDGTKAIYWNGSVLTVRGDILANSITANAVNNLGSGAVNRPIITNPNVVGQGTYYTNQSAGSFSTVQSDGTVTTEMRGFTVCIPTGVYVDSSWSVASTAQYLATCTIAGGTSANGGCNGYGRTEVVVGDGLLSGNANDPVDNQIYIRYQFEAAGNGTINVTALSWKIVKV